MSDEWNLGWLRRSQILVATGVTRCKETGMVFEFRAEPRRSDILKATGLTRRKKTKEKYSEPRRGSMACDVTEVTSRSERWKQKIKNKKNNHLNYLIRVIGGL